MRPICHRPVIRTAHSTPVVAMADSRTYGLDLDAGQTLQPQPFSLVGDGAGSIFKIFTTAAALEMGMGIDAKLEAMRPVLAGKMPIMVAAEDQKSIQAAVNFAVENKFKIVIYGGYDAEACAELLKKHAMMLGYRGRERGR